MKQSTSFQLKIAAFIFISFFVASASFYGYQIFYADNVLVKENKNKVLYIPTGADFKQVTDSLQKKEILHDGLSFMFLTKLMKYRQNIKSGRYVLKPGMSNYELIVKLRSGVQDPVNLTINNIRKKNELANKLSNQIEPDSSSIHKALNDTSLVKKYSFDTNTIKCMFIPNTYKVYWDIKVDELFNRMKKEYSAFWTKKRKNQAEKIGLSPVKVSILASIVQEETNYSSEKPTIAGVYINRLKKEQKLQADPTVKYALGNFAIKRVLDKHTKINSPYNTYKHKGLPPGPINFPSINSIKAVLNYEKHNYLFFCASPEFNGKHVFAKTYREHKINAKKYRRALNERNIYK